MKAKRSCVCAAVAFVRASLSSSKLKSEPESKRRSRANDQHWFATSCKSTEPQRSHIFRQINSHSQSLQQAVFAFRGRGRTSHSHLCTKQEQDTISPPRVQLTTTTTTQIKPATAYISFVQSKTTSSFAYSHSSASSSVAKSLNRAPKGTSLTRGAICSLTIRLLDQSPKKERRDLPGARIYPGANTLHYSPPKLSLSPVQLLEHLPCHLRDEARTVFLFRQITGA